MDVKTLRYFVETVRRNSFTQAAQALNVTQSTISKMVRLLEHEIGQPLLVRTPKGVQLTDVGRVVYERGLDALQLVQTLRREIADLQQLTHGTLTVGIPPMANVFFSALIQRFRASFPDITLQVREAGGDVVERWVAQGELEVGVSIVPLAPHEGLDHALLGRFPVCLVATPDAPWARLKRPGLASLDGLPVLMPGDGFALDRNLHAWWEQAGVAPQVVAESGQWDFLLSMAEAGMGTTILPQPLLARLKLPDDLVVRTVPAREMVWAVAHVWSRTRYLSHAARAWLQLCREASTQAQ